MIDVRKKKRKNKIALGKDEKVLNVINYVVLSLIIILTLFPLIYVVAASFSRPFYIKTNQVWLFPKGFTTKAYETLFQKRAFWRSLGNSFILTFGGTAVSMVFTVICAYFLSRRPKGYPFFLFMVLLNMWFKAGIIPSYINYQNLGLYNSQWSLILGEAIDVFNVIILKTFFDGMPKELEESAVIDGANPFQVLTKIHLPLSKTPIATITTFYIVGKWNSYLWPMILLPDIKKVPLQVLLKQWIIDADINAELAIAVITPDTLMNVDSFIYATIVVTMLPMMIMYPFVQKFFKSGILVGSVKG
ncbi:MAG: carbohydrate ABC transporter permease [Bacilli bacterium]|nr:carbohydrate ABC transporter permease [Bacilli bacterium]